MAQKRMFSLKIVDTDEFLDMPLSTQSLYFHLGMRADDEGFVGNTNRIMRMIGSSADDLKILLAKRFIIEFASGVHVIKHWKINNYIQNDRAQATTYLEEKALLYTKDNKAYTDCIQNVSIDKYSIVESSIDKNNTIEEQKHDIKGVVEYLNNKIGGKYRHTTNDTKKVIKARYNEGFTYEDFTQAIDNAYKHWSKTEDYKNMKPSTLFNGKFESRVNGEAYSWIADEVDSDDPFGGEF